MRLFRLLRLAAEAEGLHLRRMGRGYAIQAGLGAAAALFGLMLVVMLHLAAWAALNTPERGAAWAALIVAGGDLVLLALFGFLARRRPYDPIEVEALRVRRDAMQEVTETGARMLALVPLLRSQSAKKGLIGAALTAVVIGLLSRR
ncbi:hypothetical protein GCM10010964_00510 [Caldovatus sediminis]|jgi:hypothetical protein|uniref:Phage holin family protein n=1 Tax=Caldovatus sediminis TaxID=2041189 RepID=A0A8J3E9R2_9PROT|nr:hypothetical protein [Caldovatus sediminis]GGG16126.1 hypothetical protein GCM10010964_00510 [Caldovatus sediminis]